MKYLRNSRSSRLLTPIWPMMRGYGVDPYDPYVWPSTAGPNGGYEPMGPTMVVVEEEPSYETPAPTAYPPTGGPEAPAETLEAGVTPTPAEPAEGVLPGAEVPAEPLPHPYEEEVPREHPEVPAVPGAGVPAGEYVGGPELGPEAGYAPAEEKKEIWPVVVGVGACVGVLALIGLAAWGASK